MKVSVVVLPRPVLLDPQGKAIAEALASTGFDEVSGVRAGKLFEVEVATADPAVARERAAEMARTLLANPIVEDFRVLLDGEAL